MAGDLETGYILATTNDPTDDWLIQFKTDTTASEPLVDTYFGLYLVASETSVSAETLKAYYEAAVFQVSLTTSWLFAGCH